MFINRCSWDQLTRFANTSRIVPPIDRRVPLAITIYDINTFYNLNPTTVLEKVQEDHGSKELADRWNATDRKTEADRNQFYKEAIEYIYDLCWFNGVESTVIQYNRIIDFCRRKHCHKILDFGAGVGTLVLLLNKVGIYTDYFDLSGVLSEFATYRFEKHKIENKVLLDDFDSLSETYDLIITYDVLEHLSNPLLWVKKMKSKLNKNAYMFLVVPFACVGEDHPMHLKENLN